MQTTFPASLLHSPDFYAGDPYPAYRELRATSPVCRNDVTNFWALLKYEDIRFVSSNPALFSSTKGITIPDPQLPSPVQPGSLIFTDPPRHRQMRKLINSGFTRRRVAVLEPKIREIVRGTATSDVEIRGQRIAEGETVVMLYGSANRDEDICGADSEEFKVTRHPNPHIAFGCGEHSCVGAQLARLEASVMFDELLRRFPRRELVGEVDRMRATMVPGVKRMPVRLGTAH